MRILSFQIIMAQCIKVSLTNFIFYLKNEVGKDLSITSHRVVLGAGLNVQSRAFLKIVHVEALFYFSSAEPPCETVINLSHVIISSVETL